MKYNPEFHHRRSIRLKEYDYSQAGAYFVTLCVWQKKCLFGTIVDGIMNLNGNGRIVEKEWLNTGAVRPHVDLDEYMVMPNHFHGILVIGNNDLVGARRCLAQNAMPQDETMSSECGAIHGETRATQRVAPTIKSGTMGAIIGQFKSMVTKQINIIRDTAGAPLWQRNYYEHIIRDERELYAVRKYIRYNPQKWDEDEENPNMKC
jgi:REP element-mobilizing transposase RayT